MPTLDDYQISFGGLTIGDGTAYDLNEEEGLESWDVRDSDVPYPNQWGSLTGLDEVNARKITLQVEMLNDDPAVPQAFEDAFLPTVGDELAALVAKFPGRDELTLDVRCRSRSRRRQVDETLGLVKITVVLVAPDPRAYSAEEHVEAIPVFTLGSQALNLTAGSGTGLGLDLTAGSGTGLAIDFTGTPATGDVVCTNAGNVDTYPEIVFTPAGGSIDEYRLTNVTTGEVLTLTAVVAPGQQLVADMAAIATPKIGLPLAIDGETRYGFWTHPRVPISLAPGENVLRFEVISGDATSATAQVTWRDATL